MLLLFLSASFCFSLLLCTQKESDSDQEQEEEVKLSLPPCHELALLICPFPPSQREEDNHKAHTLTGSEVKYWFSVA